MITKIAQNTHDIAATLPLIQEYILESAFKLTYNEANSILSLANCITSPTTALILVLDENIVIGAAILAIEADFCFEKQGYLSKFYISKIFRGTNAARVLLSACNSWLVANQCKYSFASGTALIASEGKMFDNLLKKYGYEDIGSVLVKKA